MRKLYLLLILTLIVTHSIAQVTNQWKHYSGGFNIAYKLVDAGSYIWYATETNLDRFEKSTGNSVKYPLPRILRGCNIGPSIISLNVDNSGNVWMIKYGYGLVKFDGSVFTMYNISNSTIPTDSLYDLAIDVNNNVWIASNGQGLIKFDGSTFQAFNNSNSTLPYNSFQHVLIDASGNQLLFKGKNFLKFDGINTIVYDTVPAVFSYSSVWSAMLDSAGNVWATINTYDSGAFMFNGTMWQHINYNVNYFAPPFTNSVFYGKNNKLYFSTSQGLIMYDGNTWVLDTSFYTAYFNQHWVQTSVADSNGTVWISLIDQIRKTQGATTQYYNASENVFESNLLLPTFIDSAGNLWVGATDNWNGSVSKFDGINWQTFDNTNSPVNAQVLSITQDTSNRIWVGGTLFLLSYDGSNWIRQDSVLNLQIAGVYNITALAFDHNHNLWLGTGEQSGGYGWLMYYDGTWHSPMPLTESISCIKVDSHNNKWVGNMGGGGLIKVDSLNNITIFNSSNCPLPNDTVQCVAIDSAGRIWAGTFNGLAILDGTNWTVYTQTNAPLPGADIEYITFDNNGLAYIACDGGYCTFDGTTWNVYDMTNSPISNNDVESIAIDDNCNVWLATECGLDQNIGSCNIILRQIAGTVYQSNNTPLVNAEVDLLRYDAIENVLQLVQVTATDNSGNYSFSTVDSAVYVHLVPSPTSLPYEMPVYQNSVLVQQDASPINLTIGIPITRNLVSAAVVSTTGAGIISGTIHYTNGDLVKNLRVFLMNINNQPVGTQITDGFGFFSFSNLANGIYYVWVDKLGITNSLFTGITLTNTANNYSNLNFVLLPAYLSVVTGIESTIINSTHITVYPNPFSNATNLVFENPKSELYTLSVFDLAGRIVKKVSTSLNNIFLTKDALNNGIYFYELRNANGRNKYEGKLVIQ